MVILSKTEKTERTTLIRELDARCKVAGFTILDDATLETLKGTLSIPDIVIVDNSKFKKTEHNYVIEPDGIISVIETKNPKKDAYIGSYQALKYMSQLNCKQAFSTNFKEIIAFRVTETKTEVDERSFAEDRSHAIQNIAEYIDSVINDRLKLVDVEYKDDFIVRMLKGAVEEIQVFVNDVSSSDLEEPLGMFFAKTLNFKIEKEEKSKKELDEATKRAAAFLLVNQIVFYHVLSSEATIFPALSQVTNLLELQSYFDKVLEKDYRPVFGAKVAPLLPKNATVAIDRIINATSYLRIKNIKHDLLGKIFHSLPPKDIRKRIAAYYTSNSGAKLLAHLSIRTADDLVIDPACGSGTLLVQSYLRKKALTRKADARTHTKLLNEIYGIDIALFAAHLAAINLSLQEPLYYTDEVQIVVSDSLKVNPGGYVDFQVWTRQVANADGSTSKEKNIPLVDLVIMNPPFTNPRRMDKDYLKFIDWFVSSTRREKYLGGWRSLHAVFLLRAEDFLKENGRVAAVLPAATVYGDYARGIIDYFVKKWNVDYLIASDVETTFSEQADFKEILLVASRQKSANAITEFATLKTKLTMENAENIALKIESINSNYEDEEIRVRTATPADLKNETNWMKFFEPKSFVDHVTSIFAKNSVTGRELFGSTVIRGFEIRGPKFFFLPNEFWSIDSITDKSAEITNINTRKKLTIPSRFLIRSLRKPETHDGLISPKPEYFLLSIPRGSTLTNDLLEYINWGRKKHQSGAIEISAIDSLGKDWYSFIDEQKGTKGNFGNIAVLKKFMPTTKGVVAHYLPYPIGKIWGPNTYYFLTTGNRTKNKILTAYFNSTVFLAMHLVERRQVGKASEELTEEILLEMKYPDLTKINARQEKLILDSFKGLTTITLPPAVQQIGKNYRRKLDRSILNLFQVSDIDKRIDQLYTLINERFAKMMARS